MGKEIGEGGGGGGSTPGGEGEARAIWRNGEQITYGIERH